MPTARRTYINGQYVVSTIHPDYGLYESMVFRLQSNGHVGHLDLDCIVRPFYLGYTSSSCYANTHKAVYG